MPSPCKERILVQFNLHWLKFILENLKYEETLLASENSYIIVSGERLNNNLLGSGTRQRYLFSSVLFIVLDALESMVRQEKNVERNKSNLICRWHDNEKFPIFYQYYHYYYTTTINIQNQYQTWQCCKEKDQYHKWTVFQYSCYEIMKIEVQQAKAFFKNIQQLK